MIKTFSRYAAYLIVSAFMVFGLAACADNAPVVNPAVQSELPPKPAGLIGDTAGVLSVSDIQSLQQHAEAAGREANMQIGVSVVPTTNGRDIAEFALNTARTWGVGKFANGNQYGNRSVLIQIAVNDRKSRLEVSRHFEGVLTDGEAGKVLDLAKPDFRAKNYAAGLHKIIDGVKQKGQTQLSMNINPFNGTMLATAAPVFLGFGLLGWFVLLLVLFLIGYVIYRIFFKKDEISEPVSSGSSSGYSNLGGARGGYYGTGGGGYVGGTPSSRYETEDDDSDLTSAAAAAAIASAAYEPDSTPVELPSAYEPSSYTPEPETFGGQPDFGGGGATRSFDEPDTTPEPSSSGLFQSSTPLSSYESPSRSYESNNDTNTDSGVSSLFDSGGSSDSGLGGSSGW